MLQMSITPIKIQISVGSLKVSMIQETGIYGEGSSPRTPTFLSFLFCEPVKANLFLFEQRL